MRSEVWGAGRVGYKISPDFSMFGMSDSDPVRTCSHLAGEWGGRGIKRLLLSRPDRAGGPRAGRLLCCSASASPLGSLPHATPTIDMTKLSVECRPPLSIQQRRRAVARGILAFLLCVCCALAGPAVAHAQESSIRDILSFLVINQAVPTADVIKDREAADATRDTIARALLVELAALPLAAAPSAFTYRFNPALGTLDRLAQSFGPFFIDRAVTAGRGQISFGVTYRHATFTSLDGRELRTGTLVTIANQFRDEPQAFDVETLTLRAATRTITVSGNVGVTDWLDVGAAVPMVRFDISGERVNTYRGSTVVQARAIATANGLADIALRAKAQIAGEAVSGMAMGLEVRLPTGDPANLSGAGRTAIKGSVIGSLGRGPLELHVNGSLVGGGVSQEWGGGAALAIAATPRLTFSAESLIRRVEQLAPIADVVAPHPLMVGVDTIRLLPSGSHGTTVAAVAGIRWNPARTWLVNGHVVWAVNDRGLRARPVPTLSVDYSFTR